MNDIFLRNKKFSLIMNKRVLRKLVVTSIWICYSFCITCMCAYVCVCVTGRSHHCQVEHHMQTKFASPILHAIDTFIIDDIFFYIYITIDSIFCIFFGIFSHVYFLY